MRTQWSRASQVNCTYRCKICSSRGLYSPRKATISTFRDIALANPSSTFVYSTIFAAAVVADAKAKRDRRERWEKLIADTKQACSSRSQKALEVEETQLPQACQSRVAPIEREKSAKRGALLASIQDVVRNEPLGEKQETLLNHTEIANNLQFLEMDSLLPGTCRPHWPINTGPTVNRCHLPPQSLWSTESARKKALSEEWSEKKVRLSEIGVTNFIINMMLDGRIYGESVSEAMEYPETIRPLIIRSREELKRTLVMNAQHRRTVRQTPSDSINLLARPHQFMVRFRQTNNEEFAWAAVARKASLKRILASRKSNEITHKTFVSLLCDTLASSPIPPDVTTYNFLLTAGGRLMDGALRGQVIKTVLQTNIRPNEITCASILQHYVREVDSHGFNKFVERMRGLEGGLMLARPGIKVTPASKGRLLPQSEGKVVQRIHPTPMVFNALMEGVLRFAGFGRAFEIYTDLKTDGWGLDKTGLALFLKDCVRHRNWEGGLMVWEEMMKLREKGSLRKIEEDNALLLRLCQVCRQESRYEELS